jgi:hypothetical protein
VLVMWDVLRRFVEAWSQRNADRRANDLQLEITSLKGRVSDLEAEAKNHHTEFKKLASTMNAPRAVGPFGRR